MPASEDERVGARDAALLGFLTLVNVMNFVDRQLLASFANFIIPDLGLTNTQFGLLTGLFFIVFYSTMGLFAGALADMLHRPRLMAAGLASWSLLTAASGAARGFVSLAIPRTFIGVGESVCTPTAMSMLSDRFPASRLGLAAGVYYMGVPIGVGASLLITGYLGPAIGWRGCFYALGAIGVALSIVLLFVRETPRGGAKAVAAVADERPSFREIAGILGRALRGSPALGLTIAGGVATHFILGAAAYDQLWFVQERGFERAEIARWTGWIGMGAGVLGNLFGGFGGDWFQRRTGQGRPMFLFWVLLLLTPLNVAYRLVPPDTAWFWIGIFAAFFLLGCLYGPTFSTVQELVPPRIRGTIVAFYILMLNFVGLGFGITAGGILIDALIAAGAAQPYTWTLLAFTLISGLAIPFFFVAGRRFRADRERLFAEVAGATRSRRRRSMRTSGARSRWCGIPGSRWGIDNPDAEGGGRRADDSGSCPVAAIAIFSLDIAPRRVCDHGVTRSFLERSGSLIPRIAIAWGLATHPGPGAASSLEVQDQNVNTGLFAARVSVASSCDAELHELLTGTIGAGDYVACSTLAADGDLASGVATFTAGDLVILRNGFSVSAEASLTVEIDRELYPDAWVQDDTPDGETVYSARFYLDPTSLDLSSPDHRFFHFVAFDGDGQPELRIGLKGAGTEKRLFFEVFQDDGSAATTEDSLEFLLGSGWQWVEVGWQASSSPAGQDGSGFICLNSPAPPAGCVDLSNLDNDTGAIDFVRWGAVDVPSSSNLGPLDMDDFTSDPFADGFESGSTSAWSDPGEGPGPDCSVPSQHPTIQAAVDFPGCSSILVAPGVYTEVLEVDRSLTIEGAGPASSVLAGPLSVSGADTELSLESFGIDTTNLATSHAFQVTDGAAVYPAAIVVTPMPEPGSATLALGCALLTGLARLRRRALAPREIPR